MKLYLLRHGESEEGTVDDHRPLTANGAREVSNIVNFMPADMLANTQVLHSDKLRAQQTAMLFKDKLAPGYEMQSRRELRPDADINIILAEIQTSTQDMFVVSHLPFLGQLLSQLVTKNQYQSLIQFRPGTLVCLEKVYSDQWLINWVVSPSLFKN